MSDTRYSWSVNEEQYFGDFATVEDALEEAEAEGHEQAVYVGEKESPTQPEDWWDADDWLEHVSCQDVYGGEFAEDWETSTKEQRAELEAEVRKVMAAWLDRHNLRPAFWIIVKAKKYVKDEGKWVLADTPARAERPTTDAIVRQETSIAGAEPQEVIVAGLGSHHETI